MKVTLDLTRLLRDGKITAAEFDRLRALGSRETGELGVNILVGFGVIGVAGGGLALWPDPVNAVVLGALLLIGGVVVLARFARWLLLGQMFLILGALLLGGGIILLRGSGPGTLLLLAGLAAAAALAARSALMTALAVLCLDAALGSGAGYEHATYSIGIEQPTLTILLFGVLAAGFQFASGRLRPDFERLAAIAARTSLFLVNLGFWVGSLWGDPLRFRPGGDGAWPVPAGAFAAVWAVALLGVGIRAVRTDRRWALNLVAVFAGIHFYTQWFERLGATPASVFGAGLLVLVFALGLWRFNQRAALPVAAA